MALCSITAEQAAVNAVTALSAYLSMHTASTGTTNSSASANEVSGGSPAYARVAITWGTASSAQPSVAANATTSLVVNIPSGTTIVDAGAWTALTSGTFEFGAPLSASQTFSTQGTFTIAIGGLTFSAS